MFGRFNSPIKTSFCNNPPPHLYLRSTSQCVAPAGRGRRAGRRRSRQLLCSAYRSCLRTRWMCVRTEIKQCVKYFVFF